MRLRGLLAEHGGISLQSLAPDAAFYELSGWRGEPLGGLLSPMGGTSTLHTCLYIYLA